MVKNLIFDLDGVLIDSRRMYVELIHRALDELRVKVPFDTIDERLIPFIKGTIELVVPRHVKDRDFIILKAEYRTIELTATEGLNYIELAPDAVDTLKKLKDLNYRLFLLSNSHSKFINLVLDEYRLNQYFADVITLDSGFSSKDDAITHISETNKVNISDIIYIGDTKKDVELATRLGCICIIVFSKFSWDYPDRHGILAMNPDFIIDELAGLSSLLQSFK